MTESENNQFDFFVNQNIAHPIPVLYIPVEGHPRIEERIVVGNKIDEATGKSVLVPQTIKGETVTYKEDGAAMLPIIHGSRTDRGKK